MLEQLDAYFGALYPAESNHLMDIDALARPDVRFLVARDPGGQAIGCGAVVERGGYGEVKRMYVAPSARGQGVGAALMERLERDARAAGIALLRLELGISQPEASGLYASRGFVSIGPFGDYQPDPLSLFMEKKL